MVSKYIKVTDIQEKLDIEDLNNNLDLTDIYKILNSKLVYTFSYIHADHLYHKSGLGHKATKTNFKEWVLHNHVL